VKKTFAIVFMLLVIFSFGTPAFATVWFEDVAYYYDVLFEGKVVEYTDEYVIVVPTKIIRGNMSRGNEYTYQRPEPLEGGDYPFRTDFFKSIGENLIEWAPQRDKVYLMGSFDEETPLTIFEENTLTSKDIKRITGENYLDYTCMELVVFLFCFWH